MPRVLGEQLDQWNATNSSAKRKMHYIDLSSDKPLLNLMRGVSQSDFRNMLGGGFNLIDTGSDSDYYREHDRSVLDQVSILMDKATCLAELWDMVIDRCPEILLTTREKIKDDHWQRINEGEMDATEMYFYFCSFARKFQKFAGLPVLATKAGFDIEKAIYAGDIIYIVGSTSSFEVKLLQKMLLIRVNQIIKATGRAPDRPHVSIFCDETKYIVSRPLLEAVGTIRDKRANYIFNYQDIANLRDVKEADASLDPFAKALAAR